MRDDLANRILKACTTRLGETVTFTRGESSYEIPGIFSEVYSDVDVDTGLRVTSETPTIIINSDDLDIEPQGNDRVTIADGRQFQVREVRKDGEGGLICLLYVSNTSNYL